MEGIRIHIYNLGLDFPDGYEANEDKLLNNVLPRVLNWYSKIFSVIPIEGPINFGGFGYCIDF